MDIKLKRASDSDGRAPSPSKKKKKFLLDNIQESADDNSAENIVKKKKKKKKKRHYEGDKGDNINTNINNASELTSTDDHSDERGSPKKKKKQLTEVEELVEKRDEEPTVKKKKKKKKKRVETSSDADKNTDKEVAKEAKKTPDQHPKKEQHSGKDWDQGTTQNLCNFFLTLPVHSDEGMCQNTRITDISWDKIKVEGLSSEECHQRWNALYNIAKRRMTIGDVMPLIHKVLDDPVVRRHHGFTETRKKKSARKTVTPQQLYIDQMVQKTLQQKPQANAKEKVEHYRQKWSSLNDSQKIKWIEKALEALEEQEKTNKNEKTSTELNQPKVVVTKAEMKLKKKADGVPEPPPGSAYTLFCVKTLPQLSDVKASERFMVLGARWKALSDQEKEEFQLEHARLHEEYNKKYAEYLAGLPEEERQELEKKTRKKSVPKTPSKASVLTREMYSDLVKAGLQRQHPSMGEKDLIRKISKDFLNLTAEEKSKYLEMHRKESADQRRITDFFNGKDSKPSSESASKVKGSPTKSKTPSPKKAPPKDSKKVVSIDSSGSSQSSSSEDESS